MACFETSYNVHDWLKPEDRFVADVPPAERAAIDAYNAPFDKQLEPLRKQVMELEGSDEESAKSQLAELNKQIAELDQQLVSLSLMERLFLAYANHCTRIRPIGAAGQHELVHDRRPIHEPADGTDVGPRGRGVVEDR